MKNNSIEKRIQTNQGIVIEQLKKTPIVQYAVGKAGISRATFYRWKEESKEFAKAADEAAREGRRFINDLAESKLISAIQDQNMTAIIWWLRKNHPNYADRIEITNNTDQEELSSQQKKLLKKAIALTQGDEVKV